MELKPYQQQVISDLESFLEHLELAGSPAKAYQEYCKDKFGEYTLGLDGSNSGMRPYKDNIPGATHIAIKVPTAGGKTFIAVNALHIINKYFNQGNPKAVVWLVPWSNLLQQTVQNLSNPDHPYRSKLNSLFGNRVEVYQKDQLLQGANFNPSSALEQLNIFVFNFSSLRINSRKKEDRKVYQENGQLESFRDLIDPNLLLEETDETALINVIRSLNPVVIVDESHNAESKLSVEMLSNLNPSLVLDLTATPKSNSNIISFVNALALKKENMVKLPVVVYNHHKKEEVISSALQLQRKLELLAIEEEKVTGKYIRPIVLFQAQSNIKGKDNTTFEKIKEKLISLKIPEEQVKIKVSGKDELEGVDLMAKDCPVRYIITINALKEGWDCPNAYILASLADKSSAVDVEQILGRILRQPYVTKHQSPLLNLAFVLTASAKFNETLDNVVNGLQDAGFSKDDYYAEEAPEEEITPDEVLQADLFGTKENEQSKSDDDFDVKAIEFNPEENLNSENLTFTNSIVDNITEKAEKEGKDYEAKVENIDIDNTTNFFGAVNNKQPKRFDIDRRFKPIVEELKLPQFFRSVNEEELHDNILFEELAEYDRFLNKNNLLDGFNLANQNSQIDFDAIAADIYTVDYDQYKKEATVNHIKERTKKVLLDNILSKPKEKQIVEVSAHIVARLGDMTPISEQDLKKYVSRVFDNFSTDQIRDIIDNPFNYVQKIKQKINKLTQNYAKERFQVLLDANEIKVKEHFEFPSNIIPFNPSTSITKSLYDREESMNNYEQEMIMEIAGLDNVVFWHRNLSRGKGFFINGFESNHYPDFIIYTKRGNVVVIETKGDDRDNDDSRDKNRLGKTWAEKSGENYKYFMVFQSKRVEDTYTANGIIEVMKKL
jgi:type III restriction enzyme